MKRLFSLLAVAAFCGAPAVHAVTFTVVNTNDSGIGSLRQAIMEANALSGPDTIEFNIPAPGLQTIQPASTLPTITDAVVLDGYTQPGASANSLAVGNNAILLIEIAGGSVDGLNLNGSGSAVRGLLINVTSGFAIRAGGGGTHTIQGNWIGINPAGTTLIATNGLFVDSSNNTIGGTTPAARNVITGTGSNGAIVGFSGSGQVIQGNYIGTNATGTAGLGSGGILLRPNSLLGGTAPGAGNVIGGNRDLLIDSTTTGCFVQGNFFGVSADGAAVLANTGGSIFIDRTQGNTIGGASAAARNVTLNGITISGVSSGGGGNTVQGNFIGTNAAGTAALGPRSSSPGVSLNSAANAVLGNVIANRDVGISLSGANNTVQGNFIGTNATGTAAIPNFTGIGTSGGAGVTGNLIGGSTAAARNIISGNVDAGFSLGAGVLGVQTVQGNFIGTAADGLAALGNGGPGIRLTASSGQIIGGSAAGEGNLIAFNGANGVSNTFGTGHAILGNLIHSNAALGIDHGNDGATANDTGDHDTGPNNLQNFPVLSSVTNGSANATIAGSLNSTANTTFRLEFFSNSIRDASGFGEGENFIGATEVTTDGNSNAAFSISLPKADDGQWVTATATDPGGNTSEFSAAVATAGLVFVNATTVTARNGLAFRLQIVSNGGSSNQRFSAFDLPPGLAADPVSGIISGRPTTDGSFAVQVQILDEPFAATGILHINVVSDPNFPVIASPNEATLTRGKPFTYQIDAPTANVAADPVTYRLEGALPPGLVFNAANGTISGTLALRRAARGGGDSEVHPLSGGVITNVQLFAKNSSGTATKPLVFFLAPVGTVNISTRMAVGAGENVMIGGFIVTGNAPKRVIIRALGPSLGASGLAGALQDPKLELFDGAGAPLGANDDWKSAQEAEIVDTGIPPTDPREAAALATLAPGNYTAIVSGKNDSSGVGLVELYDLGTASMDSSSNAQLAQISTRGRVLTGEDVMIGGFIISGESARLLMRGIGPSLGAAGVAGALQDPTLSLVDSNGEQLAANDNWQDSQRAEIEATTVPPTNDAESAIVQTVAPGAYTAVLRGKDGTTGVGLVEVYNVP